MISSTFGPALALLRDGRVLATGGSHSRGAIAEAEVYDPQHNSWSAGPSLLIARGEHTATTLADGSVLVAGGLSTDNQALASAELLLPNGTWIATGPMNQPRYGHEAFLLADGRVLLIGGTSEVTASAQPAPVTNTIDLFDPITHRFTPGASAPGPVQDSTLVSLRDGRVLMIGGDDAAHGSLSDAWLYDPKLNVWTIAHPMPTSRAAGMAVTLADGKVLVAGGVAFKPEPSASGGQPGSGPTPQALSSALTYDSTSDSWSKIGDSPSPFGGGTSGALLLSDGRVLLFDLNFQGGTTTVSSVFYDPATAMWSTGPATAVRPTGGITAVLLRSGKALVVLGSASVRFDPEGTLPPPVARPVHPLASSKLTPWLILTAAVLVLILAVRYAHAQLGGRTVDERIQLR